MYSGSDVQFIILHPNELWMSLINTGLWFLWLSHGSRHPTHVNYSASCQIQL